MLSVSYKFVNFTSVDPERKKDLTPWGKVGAVGGKSHSVTELSTEVDKCEIGWLYQEDFFVRNFRAGAG